jgi:hypothetical protein
MGGWDGRKLAQAMEPPVPGAGERKDTFKEPQAESRTWGSARAMATLSPWDGRQSGAQPGLKKDSPGN